MLNRTLSNRKKHIHKHDKKNEYYSEKSRERGHTSKVQGRRYVKVASTQRSSTVRLPTQKNVRQRSTRDRAFSTSLAQS